jgi:hypothetical protein
VRRSSFLLHAMPISSLAIEGHTAIGSSHTRSLHTRRPPPPAVEGWPSAESPPRQAATILAASHPNLKKNDNLAAMREVRLAFSFGFAVVAALFFCCGLALVVFAAMELWTAVDPRDSLSLQERFNGVLEAIAVLTVSVAALELGQTVIEEEVIREAHMSAPTRVRRFLSRFMIVVVVALSVETLVAVFRLVHEQPERLPQAATIGLAAAALLAAWGVFLRLNRAVEELEPEAMQAAKSEDANVS